MQSNDNPELVSTRVVGSLQSSSWLAKQGNGAPAVQSSTPSQNRAASPRGTIEEIRDAFFAVMEAIGENEFDVALSNLEKLKVLSNRDANHPDVLFLRTLIAIQRGDTRDALHVLNDLGDDVCPELRALCLYSLQDPLWEGLAQSLVDSPKPHVAAAMRGLLERHNALKQ